MESLRSVVASMEQVKFLVSIHFQDAYLCIIVQSHRRYLLFAVSSLHFPFVALPYGLATALRVFTKLLATLMAFLHSRVGVITYIDSLLVKASVEPSDHFGPFDQIWLDCQLGEVIIDSGPMDGVSGNYF